MGKGLKNFGMCDGCDRTDVGVMPSDDGRGQFCPVCLPEVSGSPLRPGREMREAAVLLRAAKPTSPWTGEMMQTLAIWLEASAKMSDINCKMASRISLSLEQDRARDFARSILGLPPLPKDHL